MTMFDEAIKPNAPRWAVDLFKSVIDKATDAAALDTVKAMLAENKFNGNSHQRRKTRRIFQRALTRMQR